MDDEVNKANQDEILLTDKTKFVNALRELIKGDDQLKNVQDDHDYLLRFLFCCDFDVKAALERMKVYYELLLEFPEWFPKDGPLRKKSVVEKHVRVMTTRRDKEGRPIYIAKLGNVDVSTMDIFDINSVDDIWLEYIAEDSGFQQNGLCVLLDIKGIPMRMMKWMTPHNIRVALRKMEAIPVKEYRFHIVNSSFVLSMFLKVVWPFMSERLREMIKFHFQNWDSLHEHIDPESLPKDYAGTGEIDVNECYRNLFSRHNDIVESFKAYRTL